MRFALKPSGTRGRVALAVALVVMVLAASAVAIAATSGPDSPQSRWPSGGQNSFNTRANLDEKQISTANVAKLAVRWSHKMPGNVSATPAVVDGAVYVPDFGGYFTKFDATTGKVIWQHKISEYDGEAHTYSRTSPAVSGDTVYIGDHYGLHSTGMASPVTTRSSQLFAIDIRTGKLRWKVVVDSQYSTWLTQSPVVQNGVIYQGISSGETDQAVRVDFHCCRFRGAIVAISEKTHKILWKTYMVPPNGGKPGGYSGASVWGGTPALDPVNKTVIVTTGNNYLVPASVEKCRKKIGRTAQCFSPDNHVESIVALDQRTGKIRWASGARIFDSWTSACLPGAPPNNCPDDHGPDADFGDGPHMSWITLDGKRHLAVGGGQKSGNYWQLDAATGKVLWNAAPAPGGQQGGIQWGSATDGRRVFTAESNSLNVKYELPDGRIIDYGSFSALDAATGRLLWQVPDPSKGHDKAPLTYANGVLYGGSTSGHMYAMDADTGKILWDYKGVGSSMAGPAVVNGFVYWGNGYTADWATEGSMFYAFALPEQ
jgi:polyvinyl alcohol dehydrogenase (cytochrome)